MLANAKRCLCLALLMIVLIPCGCSKGKNLDGAPEELQGAKRGTIGLSLLTMTNPFFKAIAESVRESAARHGFETIVVSGEFDPARQRDQVQDFIARGVTALILTPCDSRSIGSAIRAANQAGIPVFTADIASLDPGAKVVSHIATDNYTGGRQAAEAMMRRVGERAKVAIIDHPEVESVILRTKGFRDALRDAGSSMQIVGAWPGKGSKDESFKVAQEVLQAHPDIDGFFAINDPSALGVVAAVEIARKGDDVVIIGFDGQPEGRAAIRQGKIFADPIQFPDQIGEKAVEAIVSYLQGEAVPAEVLIPTQLYTKADAERDQAQGVR